MEDGVEPELKSKPEDKAPKPHRQCNKHACKRQFTPDSKANGKKPISKPNAARTPPTLKANNQNKTQIRDVPSYIRTEMEILKHLRHVNHNLRVLLKPKCHCDRTPRDSKYCQPARERKEQKALIAHLNQISARGQIIQIKQRKNKTLNEQTDTAAKSDMTTAKTVHQSELASGISVKDAEQQQQRQTSTHAIHKRQHKCSCSEKCETVESQAPTKRQRTFQRFILCFKHKRIESNGKCEKCKCAENTKAGDDGKADNEGKQKHKIDGKVYHQKCGHHRCEKHLASLSKQDSKVAFKPRRAKQHKQGKKLARHERTLKQEMLSSCFKCLGKQSEPVPKEDEKSQPKKSAKAHKKFAEAKPKSQASKKENALPTATSKTPAEPPEQEKEVRNEPKPDKPNEGLVAVAEKLKKYCSLFQPRKKPAPTDAEENKVDLRKEFRLKQKQEKKSRYEGRHDVLNTLRFFPKPSHITVRYVEDLEEYKKDEAKRQRTTDDETAKSKRKDLISRTDTPSTSSLEEYFQSISERILREQKESDERKLTLRKKRVGNGNSHLNRRRGRQYL